MLVLREAATRLGLVRRRGTRLLVTRAAARRSPTAEPCGRPSRGGLIGPEHSALAVAWEIVLAVLEPGDTVAEEDVRALVQAVVTESGWRVAGRREPSESDTGPLFFSVLRELRWLELVAGVRRPARPSVAWPAQARASCSARRCGTGCAPRRGPRVGRAGPIAPQLADPPDRSAAANGVGVEEHRRGTTPASRVLARRSFQPAE